MACMCGDTQCSSCGPAQGNTRCPICRKWADDDCEHLDPGTGDVRPAFKAAADRCEMTEREADEWTGSRSGGEVMECDSAYWVITWKYHDETEDRAVIERVFLRDGATPNGWVSRTTQRPDDRRVVVRSRVDSNQEA